MAWLWALKSFWIFLLFSVCVFLCLDLVCVGCSFWVLSFYFLFSFFFRSLCVFSCVSCLVPCFPSVGSSAPVPTVFHLCSSVYVSLCASCSPYSSSVYPWPSSCFMFFFFVSLIKIYHHSLLPFEDGLVWFISNKRSINNQAAVSPAFGSSAEST